MNFLLWNNHAYKSLIEQNVLITLQSCPFAMVFLLWWLNTLNCYRTITIKQNVLSSTTNDFTSIRIPNYNDN